MMTGDNKVKQNLFCLIPGPKSKHDDPLCFSSIIDTGHAHSYGLVISHHDNQIGRQQPFVNQGWMPGSYSHNSTSCGNNFKLVYSSCPLEGYNR